MKTKIYVQMIEANNNTYQLSFNGSDEISVSNPEYTDVKIACLENSQTKWAIALGNQKMPGGAWNRYDLILHFNSFLYCGINNRLHKINPANGEIIDGLSYGNTPIRFVKAIQGMIIVESGSYGFDWKKYGSNLFAVDEKLGVPWKAELPHPGNLYSGPLSVVNDTLFLDTDYCFQCKVDIANGRVIECVFTK